MEHKLILEVPEDLYEPLVKTAERTGQTPEELVTEWLVTAIQDMVDDPVEEFVGAFSSSISDWADQHDRYIGKVLIEQMHDPKEGSYERG